MGRVLAATLLVLASSDPAVPPFDLGMSSHPVAGRPATIVMVFAEDVSLDDADRALAVVWADDYEGRPLAPSVRRLDVDWNRAGPRRFEGTVTFPRAGRWLLVALPDRPTTPSAAYADIVPVTVGIDSTASNWMLVAIGAAILGIGLALRGGRRARSPERRRRPPRHRL